MANRLTTSNRNSGHIELDRQCGICADVILPREQVVGLFGIPNSTEYRGCTPRFLVDGQQLCSNDSGCGICSRSLIEYVTIHYDCIEILRRNCTTSLDAVLRRLWIVAAWRKPWRRAPLPRHLTHPVILDRGTLGTICRVSGFPQLQKLPLELLEMVRDCYPHTLLWRCFPILQLAAHLSVVPPEPLVTLPLADLLVWERGGGFERVTGPRPAAHTALRLSIDSTGIHKVERLPSWPVYAGESSTRSAFIVQEQGDISDVVAHLKDGMLRLQVPQGPYDMVVWNTPAPPFGHYQPAQFYLSKTRHVVNLEEAKGITFFFTLGQVTGIHVHRSGGSHPMDTAARIRHPGLHLAWIYLPLSRDDPPLVLGARITLTGDLSILVRTQRAGGVILGPHYSHSSPFINRLFDQVLAASRPITMIYGEPSLGGTLRLFGAHPSFRTDVETQPAPFSMAYPQPNPISDRLATYFSWAPLANVSSTVAFYDDASGDCQGVVFHYEGGGARAVGQCRLQVDRAERVDRPARLCFRTENVETRDHFVVYRVQARFEQHSPSTPDDDSDQPEGWKTQSMRGIVKFWFSTGSSYLEVED
ncbi:hypothetical protein C8A05DRAFT_46825 [Staphylotrichum tortipilum]|uniref:Uncharacterized protein n=1 Tax=Staphylotrichum tortipilum TaxID=2831512 RepID=A0AAN6RQ88_9PEZI|nr:hypothetical protein C8A05DRAFT_46825 [Staphylotrichum longicolle]